MPEQPQHLARKLLRTKSFGVLSTHSVDVPGFPFGSITPYVLDAQGQPMILISNLAQHTKNIKTDAKVCLTVWEDAEGDPQAVGRLSWMGEAAVIEDAGEAKARYLSYMPSAAGHFAMHDFALYRIKLIRARYIGGFGAIFWVTPENMTPPNPLAEHEPGILQHMNDDHSAALVKYCLAYKSLDVKEARMVGIDPEGFDVLADGQRVRFDFEEPVSTPEQVRAAMVKLSAAARAA
jgi:putative heme iron utilization protein